MQEAVNEYALKGIFLGLALYGAMQIGVQGAPGPQTWLWLHGAPWAGLLLALGSAAWTFRDRLSQGMKNPLAFLFFLLLECSGRIYTGILFGAVLGALFAFPVDSPLFMSCALLGALAGVAFLATRLVRKKTYRLWTVMALAVLTGLLLVYFLGALPWVERKLTLSHPGAFSLHLLAMLPLFYLLTFSGVMEESEVEIGVICSLAGVALAILTLDHVPWRTVGFLLPVALFFIYTMRILPALRVLKHIFRGMSFARLGKQRDALMALARALKLDPNSRLAKNQYWKLHAGLDPAKLEADPETMALVDCSLCLDRVGQLLIAGKPEEDKRNEAGRLLALVEKLKPALAPGAYYWRAVLALHDRDFSQAEGKLRGILENREASLSRKAILYSAWQLALGGHPEMKKRLASLVGNPELRMEAIVAVECHLRENPADQGAWGIKRFLYSEVLESMVSPGTEDFDHAFCHDLGLAILEQGTGLERGAEYLRMAANGLPLLAPDLLVQAGKALQKAGLESQAAEHFQRAVKAGQAAGQKNLPEPSRLAFFSAARFLGELALHGGDNAQAIFYFQLYADFERSGVETLRNLASLYEQANDALAALRVTDQALIYQSNDKDLLERKDRYTYSVDPRDLAARLETHGKGFDTGYCLKRARSILDGKLDGPEWMDVAKHMAELVLVIEPGSRLAAVCLARAVLRMGEREQAQGILEKVREPKPEKFAGADDEDAWYSSCQLLGDIYLELELAGKAVACLGDFRKSAKSGARTWLKLGQAFEKLQDVKKAKSCYDQAASYEGNPHAYEAQQALYRLG
ncbi:MAG: hypothetical protein EXR99_09805 [Gemmataceae bacterium]|nr:hypothetical protein [Gemmataceae bacterium]